MRAITYDVTPLFAPLQVKRKTLRNRLVMPPMAVNRGISTLCQYPLNHGHTFGQSRLQSAGMDRIYRIEQDKTGAGAVCTGQCSGDAPLLDDRVALIRRQPWWGCPGGIEELLHRVCTSRRLGASGKVDAFVSTL